MNFEEILANCLDALERGETIESCLARHPQEATKLAPLLQLATTVRSTPQPRLSAEAFQRGREAVRAQAHYHHSLHTPFVAAETKTTQKPMAQHAQPIKPILPPRQPRLLKPFMLMYRTTGAFIALVLLLCLLTLMRNIIISLPGTPLYPIKILSEHMEGVLLMAAGEQVTWHAQQTENRLQELVTLTQQEQTATDDLLQNIDANVQATLAASNQLPLAQRNQFLLAWIERLQTIQKDKNLTPRATFALEKALATVRSATQITIAPATAPAASAPPSRPGKTFTPILVPTAIPPNATGALGQQAPTEVTVDTTAPMPIEATPAPLPTPVLEEPVVIAPTPTTAQVVMQMPKANPPSDDNQQEHHHHATQSPAEPTTDPAIAAAATETANSETENTALTAANDVKAAQVMTTSVDTAPDMPAKSNSDHSENASPQPTATSELAAPPALAGMPTATASASDKSDTPSPNSSATVASNNPADGKNTGASTPTPEATVSATSSSKRSSPTPTPKKTATPEPEKTVKPTDPPEPTDTPAPTATPADDEQAEDTPTSQPAAETTSTPSGGNQKQPGKK